MAERRPTVSIVIPVYNGEAYLEQAVDSLLAQSHEDLEIIAVNDGSTDSSLDILNAFGRHLRVIDQANHGQATSLNRGWSESQGKYIGYLSCDDILSEECISKSFRFLEAHSDCVATYCDYTLTDSVGQPVRTVRASDFNLTDLVVYGVVAPGPGALFRKSAWQQVGGWRTHLKQMPDFDFWLRLSCQGSFHRIAESLAHFRIHDASLSYGVSSESRADEPQEIIGHYFDSCVVPTELRGLRSRAMAFALLLSARLHLRSSRVRKGLYRIRMALEQDSTCLASPIGIRLIASGLTSRWRYRRYARK